MSSIKMAWPSVKMGYLCSRRGLEILKDNPKIDKIFVYERDEFHQLYQKSKIAFLKRLGSLCAEIRREGYDLVLDVSLNSQISFFSWWIGIKQRIGFNYKNRSPFLTQKVPLNGYEGRHAAEYYLDLLKYLNIPIQTRTMDMPVARADSDWAENVWKEKGLRGGPMVIGIVPGGGASWGKDARYKRWPAPKFAKLADKFVEKFSAAIILLGDQKEVELCREAADQMRHASIFLAGETTIQQFAALARKCHLVIVNDGGPLHVSVAAGARTLSIFGPVDEAVYGPYPPVGHAVAAKNLACRPCYRQFRRARCEHISCLGEITVDDIFRKAEEILCKSNL